MCSKFRNYHKLLKRINSILKQPYRVDKNQKSDIIFFD